MLGHTRCGAIQSACDGVEMGHITQLLSKIKPAVTAAHNNESSADEKQSTFINHVTQLNIANTLQHIYQRSSILHNMIDSDDIGLVGALYDVSSGKVKYKNYSDELMELDGKNNTLLADKVKRVLRDAKIEC